MYVLISDVLMILISKTSFCPLHCSSLLAGLVAGVRVVDATSGYHLCVRACIHISVRVCELGVYVSSNSNLLLVL